MAVNIQSNFPNISLSGNELLVRAVSSLVGTPYQQVTIYLKITIETIDQVIALEVDENNAALFDISFALKQLDEYNKLIPSIYNLLYVNTGTIKYSISAYEKYYNTTTKEYVFTTTQALVVNYFAIDAGYDLKKENEIYLKSTSFQQEYQDNQKYLTNLPDEQVVSYYHPVTLYFIEGKSSVSKWLRIKLTKSEISTGVESSATYYSYHSEYAIPNTMNQILFIPFFLFYTYDITSISTHYLTKIEIAYFDGENTSDFRTWHIEDYALENKKFITYQNSLGGYDSLELKGEDQQLLSKKDSIINTRKKQTETGEFRLSPIKTVYNHEHKNNIGNIADQDISYLIDLFNSNDVFITNIFGADTDNVTFAAEKVIVSSKNIVNKDNLNLDYLYNYPISYTSACMEKYYNNSEPYSRIDPPSFLNINDWYSLRVFDLLKATKGDAIISIESTVVMINLTISNFNFSSTIWWNDSVRLESWYDQANPFRCPLSFLSSANIATHAKPFFTERTFFSFFNTGDNAEDLLPILCYTNSITDTPTLNQINSYINQY